jgi:hypothetical protein
MRNIQLNKILDFQTISNQPIFNLIIKVALHSAPPAFNLLVENNNNLVYKVIIMTV